MRLAKQAQLGCRAQRLREIGEGDVVAVQRRQQYGGCAGAKLANHADRQPEKRADMQRKLRDPARPA
ncbi:hypothetical protein O0544_19265 [Edwardsiella anguillarum]|nr:hypothetical protein [Edwardsiella anguillarum]